MPLQNFVDGDQSNPVGATWLNAIDAFYFTLFSSATTAAAARTAIGAAASASVLPLAGGTVTGPINETQAIVASHATAADIWGATASDVISWTGTVTTTAFPAAPVAGARRLLICAGACKFTAGASLLIEGVQSGVTVTMKQYAMVEVTAITTTIFKLRYSLTGSFTATATGFDSVLTTTFYYTISNGIATVVPYTNFTGTSNATSFTITGFPADITPATQNRNFYSMTVKDNGTIIYTGHGVLDTSSVLTLYPTAADGNWTASAAKASYIPTLVYQI